MRKMKKWNYERKKYDDYYIPNDWLTPLLVDDMEEIVNCVQCGEKLKYGECYTSLEVHSNMGLGYGVCEKCYNEEWQRRRKDENVY